MKKLLLITSSPKHYNQRRLIEEAKNRNFFVNTAPFFDIQMKIHSDMGVSALAGENSVADFNAVIVRGAANVKYPLFDYNLTLEALVALISKLPNTYLLNQELYNSFAGFSNKLMQMIWLTLHGIPIPETRYYGSAQLAIEEETTWPVVMKSILGSQGTGVKKIRDKHDLKYYLNALLSRKVLFQDLLTSGEDYRVIVLGGKAIGAMKRKATKKSGFVTNVSAGGKIETAELTSEIRDLAERTAAVFKADFLGVDIMFDANNMPVVLEANKSPGFQGFEACTGINVAGLVIDYLQSQTRASK